MFKNAEELTEDELDRLLNRFDQTDQELQRRIIAQFVIDRARIYDALAKMFLWQAEEEDALLPKDLAEEVKELLGEKMVDAIIYSDTNETFESIREKAFSGEPEE